MSVKMNMNTHELLGIESYLRIKCFCMQRDTDKNALEPEYQYFV